MYRIDRVGSFIKRDEKMKNQFNRQIHTVAVLMLLFLASSGFVGAQKYPASKNYPFSISAGFTSLTITGNNPNNTQYASPSEQEYGGGFMGMQPGYGLMFEYSLDEERHFKIPIGIDYFNMRSASRSVYNDYISILYEQLAENKYDLFSVYSGMNWFFYRLTSVNVNFFVGAELRGNFISEGKFDRSTTYKDIKTGRIDSVIQGSETKEAATRIGLNLKAGFEGEVRGPWFIHVALGYGFMNLFGKDDNHGNLFVTKENPLNKKEVSVNPLYFTFMIQYRF